MPAMSPMSRRAASRRPAAGCPDRRRAPSCVADDAYSWFGRFSPRTTPTTIADDDRDGERTARAVAAAMPSAQQDGRHRDRRGTAGRRGARPSPSTRGATRRAQRDADDEQEDREDDEDDGQRAEGGDPADLAGDRGRPRPWRGRCGRRRGPSPRRGSRLSWARRPGGGFRGPRLDGGGGGGRRRRWRFGGRVLDRPGECSGSGIGCGGQRR